MSIKRAHSIFGDYLVGNTNCKSPSEHGCEQTEIEEHNILWKKYVDCVSGKWGIGSIPTEKGFAKWISEKYEEVSK